MPGQIRCRSIRRRVLGKVMAMSGEAGDRSTTERLAGLLRRPISRVDRRRAALHVLDWIGCAQIGRATQTGQVLASEAVTPGPVQLFGGASAEAASAAFVLGSFGSIFEMDDVHRTALLHAGPIVIPAVLAACGKTTTADEFLDAVIRGYETMIRLGRSVGSGHYALFHNTATCGGFGAAAGAASVLGLDDAALVSALGNAGSLSGGLWQCRNEPVMTKALHCAEAARRGFVAARLAKAGFAGPRFILEGPQGFFAALCPGASAADVLAQPEDGWLIWQVSFKPWPACRHAHAAIDAALALRSEFDGRAIQAIEIETYADAKLFCDRPEPATPHQAKFSLQHSVAVALLDGTLPLAAFDPPAIRRPDVASLRSLTTVSASERFTSAYPRHFGSAVSVTLAGGRQLARSIPDALGDSENPLPQGALLDKCRNLVTAAGTSSASAEAIIQAALDLAEGGQLAALRTAMAQMT